MHDYIELGVSGGKVLVRRDSIAHLRSVTNFVFDCDGTLVNTEESFMSATFLTVDGLFSALHGREIVTRLKGRCMLSALRQTGEYNNDRDSAFAIVCFLSAAAAEQVGIVGLQDGELIERGTDIMAEFLSSAGGKSVEDVMGFVAGQHASLGRTEEFGRIMRYLDYPNPPGVSPVSTLYMKLYLGAGRIDREWPVGLIGNERPLVDAETMSELISLSGGRRPAIITGNGRSFVTAALGPLSDSFDLDSSLFILDLENSDYPAAPNFRKPSDAGLLPIAERAGSGFTLYTGDSGEDMLMALTAGARDARVLFSGVTANTPDPTDFRRYFAEKGAHGIMDRVTQLPSVMRLLAGLS